MRSAGRNIINNGTKTSRVIIIPEVEVQSHKLPQLNIGLIKS